MSDPANPYQVPGADVHVPMAVNPGGSIEATLAGHGRLDLGATKGEAWERTKGSKTIRPALLTPGSRGAAQQRVAMDCRTR